MIFVAIDDKMVVFLTVQGNREKLILKTKHHQSALRERSGRVLDSRPRGRGFEPHRRHCVVVLEQDTFILA